MSENANVIEAWNTVLFDKFSRYQHVLIEGLGLHGTKLFVGLTAQLVEHIEGLLCRLGIGAADDRRKTVDLLEQLFAVVQRVAE